MKTRELAKQKPQQKISEHLPARLIYDPNSLDEIGISLRSERAKYLRSIRKAHRELMAEISRDSFLRDWLVEAQQDQAAFAIEYKSDADISAMAQHAGFRTSKAWLAARKDLADLHHHFVYAEPFKKLWTLLKSRQRSTDIQYPYLPSNGGVPRKLIDAVVTWHQAPKFTQAERRAHSKKIAAACQALEDLLGQIEPSHSHDGQYSRFRFDDKAQAGALYRAFGVSHVEDDTNPFFGTQWNASHRLQFGGVVPIWAVQNIKHMALSGEPTSSPLPAKIRAKAAKKTYFIGAVSCVMKVAISQTSEDFQTRHQLIADIVGILCGTDCTADDVRKATK